MPEFLTDWKMWGFFVGLIAIAFRWFSSQKITKNDLTHLEIEVSKISDKQVKMDETLNQISIGVAYLQGETRTAEKVINILDKSLNNK